MICDGEKMGYATSVCIYVNEICIHNINVDNSSKRRSHSLHFSLLFFDRKPTQIVSTVLLSLKAINTSNIFDTSDRQFE